MPPRKKYKYSNDNLLKAVADIKTNKISTRVASQKYCIHGVLKIRRAFTHWRLVK